MPKYDIDDDPAFALNEQSKALALDNKLNRYLDEIATTEQARNEASEKIRRLWLCVEREGFDLRDARRRFVTRSLAGASKPNS